MSLFPQGASTGMGSFSADEKNKQGKEEKAVEVSTQGLGVSEEVPLSSFSQDAASSAPIIEGGVPSAPLSDDLPKKESLPSEKPKNDHENDSSEMKKDIKNNSKKEEEKKKKEVNFKSSVNIAGLTNSESIVPLKQDKLSEEKEGPIVSDEVPIPQEDLYENLSDTEKEELDSLAEDYFEKFPSDVNPDGGIALNDLLDLAIDKEASDIHFSAGSKIGLRIFGKIHFIDNIDALNNKQARNLIFALVSNPLQRKEIYEEKELDASYEHYNGVNFRINIFFKRGKVAAVLRKIASNAMSMDQLGLPPAVQDLLQKKQGLLLVTGPTGSGKSTSMQSMLEYINKNRVEHILTIEDPIEYIFENKKSIFSQREVGKDTHTFSAALRASLREDPDVVMIGEMRDAETIQAAMKLSETGHLVISTLHTASAPQTISRLVSYFASTEQEQVRSRLADSLLGVLSQRLISRIDREGRVAIYELMIVNSAIRNIIRTGDMTQIHNAMLSGREIGMILMEDYARELEAQEIVRDKDFMQFFREE
ncbi:PilT/PilU family type 4a pilus ATPase [Candidatus Peregrinibacteria bacterium]|jgi:twitching motility protein PilT|nr:PilT/PilU family type 4a pilus ATPase [Candidatus Peregrinibacteria bacterium]